MSFLFRWLALAFFLCASSLAYSQDEVPYLLQGHVYSLDGEALAGVHVYDSLSGRGCVSNAYGYFSMRSRRPEAVVKVLAVGYEPLRMPLSLQGDMPLQIFKLRPAVRQLDAVEVTAYRTPLTAVATQQVALQDVRTKAPMLFGEADLMRLLQQLPGVQGGQEGSTSLYVRGGDAGQNLILLDGVPVYHTSHAMGLLSVFNTDALKSVEMVKGGFPARYGGRLSSVVDIRMKEGNTEHIRGSADIGMLSTKLTLDGPLGNRSSFMLSGRTMPWGFLVDLAQQGSTDRFGYNFYDLSAKYQYKASERDRLYASVYYGLDLNRILMKDGQDESRFALYWGNLTGTLRWNRRLAPGLFSNLTLLLSDYDFGTKMEYDQGQEQQYYRFTSGIREVGAKWDMDYTLPKGQQLLVGGGVYWKQFTPSAHRARLLERDSADVLQPVQKNRGASINALEVNAYGEYSFRLGERLEVNAGLHAALFATDDTTYYGLQPRLSAGWQLGEHLSLKASYARMQQFIHLLGNEMAGLPTDMWVPSSRKLRPEDSRQWTLGLYGDQGGWAYHLELYHKRMDRVVAYRQGYNFLTEVLNMVADSDPGDALQRWDENILMGQGTSKGMELGASRRQGRWQAELAYTLSWTDRKFAELNRGGAFPFRYDRRHNLVLNGHVQLSKRIRMSVNWYYASGMHLTLAEGQYPYKPFGGNAFGGAAEDYYYGDDLQDNERVNNYTTRPSHRLDISWQFYKQKGPNRSRTWTLALYNVYARKNPYMVFADGYSVEQISLFGSILPFISYQLSF